MSDSKMFSLFWLTIAMRSSPRPVSMEGFGRGFRFPVSSRLYCMKTRFQSSRNRGVFFASASYGSSGPYCFPRSMYISEHGPQGPVGPMLQKFSSSPFSMFPNRNICLSGMPMTFCHMARASSSSE